MFSKRILDIISCSFFAMIVFFPVLNFNFSGKVSSENRMLADFPAFPDSCSDLRRFNKGVEDWLDDRLGFRKQLVTIYRRLELGLFGVSPSKLVALGRDETAYLIEPQNSNIRYQELYDAVGESGDGIPLDKEQFAHMAFASKILSASNTPALLLAVPTSPLFNYEKLPLYLRKVINKKTPDHHPLSAAIARFKTHYPEYAHFFLYPFKETLDLAKSYSPYPQKNFHWSWSPFTVMVSEMIAERFGQPVHHRFSPTDFSPCVTQSDLAHLVGVPDFMNNNDLCPSGEFYSGEKISGVTLAEAFPDNKGAHSSAGTYYTNTAVPSGKILVIGDSFNFSLGIPLARNFREVLVLDYYGVIREAGNKYEDVLRQIKISYRPERIVIVRHNLFMDLESASGIRIFLDI